MIFRLDQHDYTFPDPTLAEQDGLLAVGGDLSAPRLLMAYAQGIFPWYSEDTPILWYAPPLRFVLRPDHIKVSKSMRKVMSSDLFQISYNKAFQQVIHHCASIERKDQDGTWIVQDMLNAYIHLHELGFAHSIEVWHNHQLVGGLYGVLVGRVFCGESMFSRMSNASKAALIYLSTHFDLELIDCQIHSDHLQSLGAEHINCSVFYNLLQDQQYAKHGLDVLFRNS